MFPNCYVRRHKGLKKMSTNWLLVRGWDGTNHRLSWEALEHYQGVRGVLPVCLFYCKTGVLLSDEVDWSHVEDPSQVHILKTVLLGWVLIVHMTELKASRNSPISQIVLL